MYVRIYVHVLQFTFEFVILIWLWLGSAHCRGWLRAIVPLICYFCCIYLIVILRLVMTIWGAANVNVQSETQSWHPTTIIPVLASHRPSLLLGPHTVSVFYTTFVYLYLWEKCYLSNGFFKSAQVGYFTASLRRFHASFCWIRLFDCVCSFADVLVSVAIFIYVNTYRQI